MKKFHESGHNSFISSGNIWRAKNPLFVKKLFEKNNSQLISQLVKQSLFFEKLLNY